MPVAFILLFFCRDSALGASAVIKLELGIFVNLMIQSYAVLAIHLTNTVALLLYIIFTKCWVKVTGWASETYIIVSVWKGNYSTPTGITWFRSHSHLSRLILFSRVQTRVYLLKSLDTLLTLFLALSLSYFNNRLKWAHIVVLMMEIVMAWWRLS